MKASLSFTSKFLWATTKLQIWATHADNTLTPYCAILVPNILDGYDIDRLGLPDYRVDSWGSPKSVHLYPLLMLDILSLYSDGLGDSSPCGHFNRGLEDIGKANKHPVVFQRALYPPVKILEMFATLPIFETLPSCNTTSPITNKCLETTSDREGGLLLPLLQQRSCSHSIHPLAWYICQRCLFRHMFRGRYTLSPSWHSCYNRFSLGFTKASLRLRCICRCTIRQYVTTLMHLRGE